MDEFSIIAILTVSIAVGKFVNHLHTARTKKSCKWLGIGVALAINVLAFFTIPVPRPEVYPAGGILTPILREFSSTPLVVFLHRIIRLTLLPILNLGKSTQDHFLLIGREP